MTGGVVVVDDAAVVVVVGAVVVVVATARVEAVSEVALDADDEVVECAMTGALGPEPPLLRTTGRTMISTRTGADRRTHPRRVIRLFGEACRGGITFGLDCCSRAS